MTELTFIIGDAFEGLRLLKDSRIYTPNMFKRDITKADWDSFDWTFKHLSKPTFAQMVEYATKWKMRGIAGVLEYRTHQLNQSKKAVLSSSISDVISSGPVHTGKGLGHMAGLLQMVEQATTAGSHLPQIQMQNPAGGSHRLHTQSDIRKILEAAAKSENIVESCHNIVIGRWRAKNRFAQTSANSNADRLAAANEAKEILTNYETLLKAEVAAFDPDALPTDLYELKQVLKERLEAAALDRVKYLRGVSTQQGIDLPATCPDAADAEESIAVFRYKGSLLINRAETEGAAKRYFELYTSNINKVVVANSPFFTLRNGSAVLPANFSRNVLPDSDGSRRLALSVKQLDTQPDDVLQVVLWNGDGTASRDNLSAHQIDFTLKAEGSGRAVFELYGRNLCGPTKQVVIFE